MPRSKRYGRAGGLPATIRRSSSDVQEAFTKAHQEAVQVHGESDQADRAAFEVLKQRFEKRGDHWIAKRDPVGRSANPVPHCAAGP
jgi:hypothetical protein